MDPRISTFHGVNMKCLVLLGIVTVAASSAARAEGPDDLKAMDGVWLPVKAELGGKPMPDAVLKTITLKVDDGKYEVVVGKEGADSGTCKLVPDSSPKGMDIEGKKGPNEGKTFLTIYELKGDTLRVCYDLSGKSRPKEFKTEKGTALYLVTYERKKP